MKINIVKKLLQLNSDIYILEILKNASTSIRRILENSDRSSEDLHNKPLIREAIYLPNMNIGNNKIVAIYRDPVERCKSVYADKVLNYNINTHLCRVMRMKEIDTFDKYLDFISKYKNTDSHTAPQIEYLKDVKLDYIIPIEKLDEFILNNTNYKPIHSQISNSNFEITEEQEKRIIDLYKEDYDILNTFKVYEGGKI